MPRPRPDEGLQSPRREVIGLFKGRDLSGTCGIPRECDRVYVGGRVSAEGPQRRSRCAQKAHMARRKELAHKVNRPPRDARADGVRQPRGEVRRVHGPHGRAQDDMASGRALVRRETEPQNITPGPSTQLVPRVTRDVFSRQAYSAVPNARTVVSDALSPTGLPMAPSIRERIRDARSRKNDSKSSAFI